MELQKGQRISLAQVLDLHQPFVVGMQTPVPQGEVDGACFGLDGNGRVADERYVTYYNQPMTPCGGVQLASPRGDQEGFELLLDAVPAHIVRFLFVMTVDDESSFADMRGGHARLLQGDCVTAIFRLDGAALAGEKALILLEIYRKDADWRVAAVGQGFAGGMADLVTEFGIQAQSSDASVTSPPIPPLALLGPDSMVTTADDADSLQQQTDAIERTLEGFKVKATVVGTEVGPIVTTFALRPAPGVKVSRIRNLETDLALALSSPGLRVDPMFQHGVIGIEIPNRERQVVPLRRLLQAGSPRRAHDKPLLLPIGVDARGNPQWEDLEELPHLLVAGTTRSGKSVALHAMLGAVLFGAQPSQVRLLLVDPKGSEFTIYDGIPHLLAPVITQTRQTMAALGWLVGEMEARYRHMASLGVRNRAGLQMLEARRSPQDPAPAVEVPPLLLLVIDELADLMLQSGKAVEEPLVRLAQMGRAAGIHLILATQRPSRDVLTGLIKANMPARLAFRVTSSMESRIILDEQGAENLLGKGDGLLLVPGNHSLARVQTPFVTEAETEAVIRFLKRTGTPNPAPDLLEVLAKAEPSSLPNGWSSQRDPNSGSMRDDDNDED
ncbi:DNA translocase FtsK [Candidatus Symbiobacter mobilis]|uniref:DNA segregation protein n=1 Tax=Candidatus Symbiobacter mobilis CR TaxID=946483 RepID=U5NB29_9BURK|nr:DNA translocase FtsK [Candidatus Symbiobacter mobilis]AGX87438.1 DNA segregation protein [Candidatus Symbiobacter mobilis CR]